MASRATPRTGAASMAWWDEGKTKFNTGSGLLRRHDLGDEPRRLGRQLLSRRRRRATRARRPADGRHISRGGEERAHADGVRGAELLGRRAARPGRGRRRAPGESARFSARSWRDRASGVVAMGDGASMSAGSSPTTGAAASRRRCAWRLAFFACARARFSAGVTRASPLGAGIYLGGSSHVDASVSGLCLRCRRRVSTRRGDGVPAG